MQVVSLSASSISSYLGCPKRFLAEQVRVRPGSAPGDFGTAVHTSLEWLLKICTENPSLYTAETAREIWTTVHNKTLGYESDYFDTGTEMMDRFVATRPLPAKMLSQEVKEAFFVTTEDGSEVRINYIIDMVEEPEPGKIKVVDWKTQWAWVSPAGMRSLIQPILYAAAARRKYGVGEVEVEYVLLRHEPMDVSVTFDSYQMDTFERFLADIAQQILDDTDAREKLNDKCNFCLRKAVCGTLAKAIDLEWTPTLPLETLVERREQAIAAEKASKQLVNEIDEVLLAHLRTNNVPQDDIGEFTVSASARRTGAYDPVVVYEILGPSALPYMKVGKTALDKEVKRRRGGIIPPEQRDALVESINYTYGEPTVKVARHGAHEEGE